MYFNVATLIVPGTVAIILDVLRAEMGTRGAEQFHIGFDGKTCTALRAGLSTPLLLLPTRLSGAPSEGRG